MDGTNIEAWVGMSRVDKGGVVRVNIEASKKAGVEAVVSTNNNSKGSSKVID